MSNFCICHIDPNLCQWCKLQLIKPDEKVLKEDEIKEILNKRRMKK